MGRGFKNRSGYVLITAILASAVVAIILTVMITVTIRNLRDTRTTQTRLTTLQKAESTAEFARMQVLQAYRCSHRGPTDFVNTVLNGAEITCTDPDISIKKGEVKSVGLFKNTETYWTITDAKSEGSYAWVEITATAREGDRKQTVIQRVAISGQQIFDLAMLSEKTDCIYCHLRVNGDVGSLVYMRPGWGSDYEGSLEDLAEMAHNFVGVTEETYTGRLKSEVWSDPNLRTLVSWPYGVGSGGEEGGSIIRGSVYAAQDVADDASGVYDEFGNYLGRIDEGITGEYALINGALIRGEVETYYAGPKLPDDEDGDGIADFPAIEAEAARESARGQITGGALIYGVPEGETLDNLPQTSNLQSIENVYEGSLILVGTEDNPIVLEGNIYVTGDVILKGVVKGRGAIYAERNLYLAGDVVVDNPPDPPGEGVCAGVSDPDECARRNIADGRDELRLAARNNIVIGDYTEFDENENLVVQKDRQAALYFRSQFDFNYATHYFDRETGDELIYVNGTYLNPEGKPVPADRVIAVASDPGSADDAYTYAFRPGWMEDGEFEVWLPDHLYRELLGTKTYSYRSWRAMYYGWSKQDIIQDLVGSGVPPTIAFKIANLLQNPDLCKKSDGSWDWSCLVQDFDAGGVQGRFYLWINAGEPTVSIIIDNPEQHVAPVTEVHAFLYSNKRIAGQSNMMAMAVNGGLVARDIGILVPGRFRSWWLAAWPNGNDKYRVLEENRDCDDPGDPYYVPGTEDCAFTINYDHRLRNGGFGFDLVKGSFGAVLHWRVADRAEEHLNPGGNP